MGRSEVFALLCYLGLLVIAVIAVDDEYDTDFESESDYDSELFYYYNDEKPKDCKFKMKLAAKCVY